MPTATCYWPSGHGCGAPQGCVFSPPPLFIIYMNWIDSHSRVDKGVTVGSCRIDCLLFVDNLVLFASSKQGLQHVLDNFSAECD